MASENRESEGLTLLGNQGTVYSSDYDPTVLETFENKHAERDYMVTFRCPEFTTLCPITGQPDFATLYINYIPHIKMVESKSLKLYLFSFRNHGDFHEDVTNVILNDLVKLMEPKYIEVRGMFYPRGGISIYPFANWANPDFGYEGMAKGRMFEQLSDLDTGDGAR
ncbi:NADPH-dependent 7-cyano-7-deazaguanine reductase [Berryella intestinalis]|uniref:NADPH-dependent 7-cyano-7-deazaguanine reductase n=1 Tax=Berryella intestinalis TaxID=1531429 RepID=A0A0A8B534_9ACTN|nr:preQ(1) synthase [Berryella intestinalis]AJC12571.1 NADPH-dependent 7-cyano-7-deazaguanine reductase [Berryella intestinalis]